MGPSLGVVLTYNDPEERSAVELGVQSYRCSCELGCMVEYLQHLEAEHRQQTVISVGGMVREVREVVGNLHTAAN